MGIHLGSRKNHSEGEHPRERCGQPYKGEIGRDHTSIKKGSKLGSMDEIVRRKVSREPTRDLVALKKKKI